ncbi:MAG: NAD(P)H-binding protein [Solirubrobacteraceae bacterium]|nr:NAD(P)H-binding protein [Solirubrobacteraceae bacterium]
MRALIVGGGGRGLALAEQLRARGDAARVVTRKPERRAEIEAVGAEYLDGDPDRIGTLRYACENVTILVWALATATGDDLEKIDALHGSRLQMMLERTIDTTVRGVIYEARGTLPGDTLARGREVIERMCRKNEIPFTFLEADPADTAAWVDAADDAIAGLLAMDRG